MYKLVGWLAGWFEMAFADLLSNLLVLEYASDRTPAVSIFDISTVSRSCELVTWFRASWRALALLAKMEQLSLASVRRLIVFLYSSLSLSPPFAVPYLGTLKHDCGDDFIIMEWKGFFFGFWLKDGIDLAAQVGSPSHQQIFSVMYDEFVVKMTVQVLTRSKLIIEEKIRKVFHMTWSKACCT